MSESLLLCWTVGYSIDLFWLIYWFIDLFSAWIPRKDYASPRCSRIHGLGQASTATRGRARSEDWQTWRPRAGLLGFIWMFLSFIQAHIRAAESLPTQTNGVDAMETELGQGTVADGIRYIEVRQFLSNISFVFFHRRTSPSSTTMTWPCSPMSSRTALRPTLSHPHRSTSDPWSGNLFYILHVCPNSNKTSHMCLNGFECRNLAMPIRNPVILFKWLWFILS